eukprot:2272559-Rhodomonas_salina.1
MAATEEEYTPGPDEIYAYAFQAVMAAIRQNVDKHCYNCGVMGHISRNCPGKNPQFTSQRERVSRWDRAGVWRQSSAPPAYGRGANPMGPGGRGFSSPMGGRGAYMQRESPMGGRGENPMGGRGGGWQGAGGGGSFSNTFGRGVASRPLSEVIPGASMYAEREQYYKQEHEIHPQQFEDSFKHGFQAFIPCQQQQDPATDHNAQFQEQVFG